MAKTRPYQAPLEPDLAAQILSIPLPETGPAAELPPARTLGEKLQQSLVSLAETVALANDALAQNSVAQIVADSLAKKLKKRGVATISVSSAGEVVLQISYEGEEVPAPVSGVVRGKWHSDLPTLDEMRAEAADLGVDITHLGRRRREIFRLLTDAKAKLRGPVDEITLSPKQPATFKLRRASTNGVIHDNE